MEIRSTFPPAPVPSQSTEPKVRLLGQQAAGAPTPLAPDAQPPAAKPDVSAGPPPIPKIRAELRFDKSINRVVGRIIDETTGKEVRELPPEELRSLYAKTREMLGPLVDEVA